MARSRTRSPVPACLAGALLLTAAACRPSGGAGAPPEPAPADSTTRAAAGEHRGTTVATADQWRGSSAARVEELFRGRFPGVRVVQTPGGMSIRLRGASSVNGSNEPLFVIDGTPVEAGPGGLIGLNPGDIARIEVLKDIGSTAFYGVRGANGVVLITTKRAP